MNAEQRQQLERLARKRSVVALVLTAAMMTIYFGFILLIAFDKELMSSLITTGLSVGILLGALVIVSAWILTYIYVRWANDKYDTALAHFSTLATPASTQATAQRVTR